MTQASLEIRVWTGWRLARLVQDAGGWSRFVSDLAATFVPATWLVMRHYGLNCYVPSVLPEIKAQAVPDEVALLFYESRDAYNSHKLHVAGRSYSVMHQALFEFADPGRKSRSEWAVDLEAPPDSPGMSRRRRAGSLGLALSSSAAKVHFAAIAHPAGTKLGAEAVLQVFAAEQGEAVVQCVDGLTLLWLAAGLPLNIASIASQVAALVPGSHVVASHVGRPTSLNADYFSDQSGGVELASDQTLHFT